jgi:hypothetical protein
LDKAGKSIPSMSDDEKKAFFNKVDAAWKGKGEKKVNELQFLSQKELDDYKKKHKVRPGTELKLAPLSKRVGHSISKKADNAMDAVGRALYTTKLGNSAMKGTMHLANKAAKAIGLPAMTDKESDREIDAWKDIYNRTKKKK